MNTTAQTLSESARARFLAGERKPLFLCEWPRVLFVHYAVDAEVLQREVPFELELHEGRAVVSLVAFEMRRFRPRVGGRLGEWLFLPAATNRFLNVRAYVRHEGEPGVYFMHQWFSHPFSLLGKLPFLRLPWHWGRIRLEHQHEAGRLSGVVRGFGGGRLSYSARIGHEARFIPAEPGSLAEFTMECYSAFALRDGRPVRFRVWHAPWPQCPVEARVENEGLLERTGKWFRHAQPIGAHYTTGCDEVWMGSVRALKS